MAFNDLVENVIREELEQVTHLPEDIVAEITEKIKNRITYKRQVITLSFLTDQMYDAMKTIKPDLDYKTANALYRSAIEQYHRKYPVMEDDEDFTGR